MEIWKWKWCWDATGIPDERWLLAAAELNNVDQNRDPNPGHDLLLLLQAFIDLFSACMFNVHPYFQDLAERSSLCYHCQSLGFCPWKSGNVIFGIPEPVPFNYLSVQLFSYMHFPKRTSVTCTIPNWDSQYTNGSSCMFSSVWSLNHIGGSEIEVLASWSVIYSCLECLDPPSFLPTV